MLKRSATVIWWLGVMCLASGIWAGLNSSSLSEARTFILLGIGGGFAIFSFVYILSGNFLRPPTGPLSKDGDHGRLL